jgi:hypothetical protein
MLIVGVLCFAIAWLNQGLEDKFWFPVLIAFVSVLSVPIALLLPESGFMYLFAIAWHLLVVVIGSQMDLKKYHIILWLYPTVMMAIFLKWMFWTNSIAGFDAVHQSILYITNTVQVLLLLVLSDAGRDTIHRIRDRFRSGHVLDDHNSFQNRGR